MFKFCLYENEKIFSIFRLDDSIVVNFILVLAENGHLTPDIVLVDVEVLALRHIKLFVLIWKDSDLIWVISLHRLAVFAHLVRDAILDIVLQLVMSLLEFVLLSFFVTDLDGEGLLLTVLGGQIMTTLCDTTLCNFIQHLELVEKFTLVRDEVLLLVELVAQLGKLSILLLLLCFQLCLESTLFIFFHLDHRFLGFHMHSQQFSLLVKLLLLLSQFV